MNPAVFTKRYRTPDDSATAAAHHQWLISLRSGLSFPALLDRSGAALQFEYIPGTTAVPSDLPAIAEALGQLHRAAREHGLRGADVNQRIALDGGHFMSGFAPPRRARLHAALLTVRSPLTDELVDNWLAGATQLPAALYKDANPRNVIFPSERGPIFVDFDTLTLAPVGYDLAKLLVTTSMSFGSLTRRHMLDALAAYTAALDLDPGSCTLSHVQVWAEFHHLLTSPWLGRHYTHDWAAVRPWREDEILSAAKASTTTART